ncbi:MAG: hypothetical protein AB7L13_13315 [Acidimicrobiia bacterium]
MSNIRRVTAASALSLMFLTAGANAAGADNYAVPIGTATIAFAPSRVALGSGAESVVATGFVSGLIVKISTTWTGPRFSSAGTARAASTSVMCGDSADVPADANGKVDVTVVTPEGATGTCAVSFSGTGTDGNPAAVSTEITVADSTTAEGTGLPRTGSDSLVLARYGLVLVGVGGLMAVSARRASRLRAAIEG